MKSIISIIALLLAFLLTANAFSVRPAMVPRTAAVATKASTSTSLNMVFGNKKSAAQKAADAEKAALYWQGEWVCKDCGYIYNRVSAPLHHCLSLSSDEQRYVMESHS
jgi:hypothetical protein